MRWLRTHPKLSVAIAAAVVGALGWLVFGFFGFHLLFVDDAVDEAAPVFTSAETTPPEAVTPTSLPTATTEVRPELSVTPTTIPNPTTTPLPTTTPPPQIVTSHRGDFVSREHPTTGDAIVLGDGSPQRFLRFERFETDNGPDVNVYLVNSSAGGVEDFVDLGDLKGNIGDQNYEIPADIDLSVYDTVLLWCVRFSSPFGEARLAAA